MCVVDWGVVFANVSVFLAASIRNIAPKDISVMCLSVALAPLDRRACFMVLHNIIVCVCVCGGGGGG